MVLVQNMLSTVNILSTIILCRFNILFIYICTIIRRASYFLTFLKFIYNRYFLIQTLLVDFSFFKHLGLRCLYLKYPISDKFYDIALIHIIITITLSTCITFNKKKKRILFLYTFNEIFATFFSKVPRS